MLVLDEPATGLDLKNQVRVLSLLRELMADGMALLLSTHHPDHALYVADRVVLLGRGGARTGAAAELLTDTALSALYGVPVRTVSYSDGGTRPPRPSWCHYGDGSDAPPVAHHGHRRSLTSCGVSPNALSAPAASRDALSARERASALRGSERAFGNGRK